MAEQGRKSAWGRMGSQAPSIIALGLVLKAFIVPTVEKKFILREQVLSIEIIVLTACIASMWMRSRETGKLLVMDKWSPSG